MLKTATQELQTYKLQTNVALVYEDAEGPRAHPPDLNMRGMFISTRKELPVGSLLRLQFQLALSDIELTVKAKVRYSLPGSGVGVEFLDLPPQAVQAIQRELQMMSTALAP